MGRFSANTRNMAAATRGQIVQRVLVDGWSAAQAGAAFGVGERQVARWVAAYRRHGMASLRDNGAGESAPRRWIRRLCAALGQMAAPPDAGPAHPEAARFVRLHRQSGDSIRR